MSKDADYLRLVATFSNGSEQDQQNIKDVADRLERLHAAATLVSETAEADADTFTWRVSRGAMSELREALKPIGVDWTAK